MSSIRTRGALPPGVSEHLARYAGWSGTDAQTEAIELSSASAEDGLTSLAADLPAGDVVALIVTSDSGRRQRGAVRRLSDDVRRSGFQPLGWHPSASGTGFCLYVRRIAEEPGIPEAERCGPVRPPEIPVAPADVESSVTGSLEELSQARRLADWMYAQYADRVRGRVAEIGAGIGTFSEKILEGGAEELLLIEPADSCTPVLRERFGGDPRVRVVSELLPEAPSLREGGFDLIVCQNVLEHIGDDVAAARGMAQALTPDGTVALLVPAHPGLFGGIDDSFGHYRRYTPDRIRSVFSRAGLEVTDLHHFNALGILGWWAKNLRPGGQLTGGSLRAYELLVRMWRPIEDRIRPPFGLSLVAHGRPSASRSAR